MFRKSNALRSDRESVVQFIFCVLALLSASAFFNEASAQSKKALNFFEQERYDEAIRILKKDFYSDQNDLASGMLLAKSFYRVHKYEEALDVLNLVNIERMSQSRDVMLYADALIANDDFSAAYLTLIEWLSHYETDSAAYVWLDKTAKLLAWDSLHTLSDLKEISGLNTFSNEYAPYTAPNGELWYVSDQNTLRAVFPAAFTNQNIHLFFRTQISKQDSLKMNKPRMLMRNRDYYYHDGAMASWPQQEEYAMTLREIDGMQHALRFGIYFSNLTGMEDDIRPFEHNGKFNTGHPTFSLDGSRMYFSSDREGGYGQMDLWYSDFENGTWTEPVNMGPEINTSGNEVYPVLNDFRLYYSSDRRDMGYGGLDLYYISLLNRPFKPYNLRTPINSAYDDFSIHFTGPQTGYLASNRPGGAGGDDIYAFRFVPEHLPIDTMEFKIMPLNDAEVIAAVYDLSGAKIGEARPDEFGVASFPELTTSSVYMLRLEGSGAEGASIYRVDDLGNEVVLETESPGQFAIEILDDDVQTFARKTSDVQASKDSVAQIDSTSTEGEETPSELTSDMEKPLAETDPTVKPTPSDEDTGLTGLVEEEPLAETDPTVKPTPSDEDIEFAGLVEGEEFIKTVPTVYYDFDSFHLREDAKEDLNALAKIILNNRDIHIKVISHTDSRGPKAYNLTLSEKRARSVINYLAAQGVALDRLTSEGKGESELTNDCDDRTQCSNEDHAKNRRTEFVFMRGSTAQNIPIAAES